MSMEAMKRLAARRPAKAAFCGEIPAEPGLQSKANESRTRTARITGR
jgi:hypothetical protein